MADGGGGQPVDEVGARILDAALDLLRKRGPRAVTMQAIAETTGIAKTTIYRRHQNRRALLAAALEGLVIRPSIQSDLSRDQRLRWVISQSVEVIADGIGVGGFAALLTNEDPEFSEAFRAILGTHRAKAIEAHGSEGGDGDTLIDMIVGGYVAEFARTGTIASDWGERVSAVLNRRT